jgi:hypothetical protein
VPWQQKEHLPATRETSEILKKTSWIIIEKLTKALLTFAATKDLPSAFKGGRQSWSLLMSDCKKDD